MGEEPLALREEPLARCRRGGGGRRRCSRRCRGRPRRRPGDALVHRGRDAPREAARPGAPRPTGARVQPAPRAEPLLERGEREVEERREGDLARRRGRRRRAPPGRGGEQRVDRLHRAEVELRVQQREGAADLDAVAVERLEHRLEPARRGRRAPGRAGGTARRRRPRRPWRRRPTPCQSDAAWRTPRSARSRSASPCRATSAVVQRSMARESAAGGLGPAARRASRVADASISGL